MLKFNFGKFKIDRASHRLRAYLPCQQLNLLGHRSEIVKDNSNVTKDDVVVFSKDSDIELMIKCKEKGAKVGFDICDNKFDDKDYLTWCLLVDFITVNTTTMQQIVKLKTNKESFIYVDCVQRDFLLPTTTVNSPLKLLWYGGSSSMKYVGWKKLITELNAANINFTFDVCSSKLNRFKEKMERRAEKGDSTECVDISRMNFYEWTWDMQGVLMQNTNIIMIPLLEDTEYSNKRTMTKSPNRIIDGIAQGKWVVSSKLPGYNEFDYFTWLDDPVEGVEFYLEKPTYVIERIKAGQEWVRDHYSPTVVAKQLLEIYDRVKQ